MICDSAPKKITESRIWHRKTIQKAAFRKYFTYVFVPCIPRVATTGIENRPSNRECYIMRSIVFQNGFSLLESNFIEASQKVIIIYTTMSLFRFLRTVSAKYNEKLGLSHWLLNRLKKICVIWRGIPCIFFIGNLKELQSTVPALKKRRAFLYEWVFYVLWAEFTFVY